MEAAQSHTRARYVMGTIFEITVRGVARGRATEAMEEAFAAIRRSDEILSHWRADSAVSRLNRAPGGVPVRVPDELYALLELAERYRRVSRGAFDVTVAPLVRLWRECAAEDRLPRDREIRGALSKTGAGCLELLGDGRVRRLRLGCAVQFGAIGKGWAVDRAAAVLRRHGIRNAFISAGTSSVRAMGDDGGGAGWLVGIRDPRRRDGVLAELRLQDGALSTSAVGERDLIIGGRPYAHILDPRTGYPAAGMLSVTIAAPTAAEADALSTAAFVLGVAESAQLLGELCRDAYLLDAGGEGHIVRCAGGELLRWEDP